MRTCVPGLLSAIVFATLSLTTALQAQKFQEPSREELQMTSDPKAPGAAAVYLNREIRNDNQSHFIGEYARIKVLTEQGKEWATVEIPYHPATVVDGASRHLHEAVAGDALKPIIEARTIHPDGTIVPLTGKAEDLLVYATVGSRLNVMTFNLPSVEVGSILEYKWTIPLVGSGKVADVLDSQEGRVSDSLVGSIPVWNLQTKLFAHREYFYFNPFTSIERADVSNEFIYYADGEIAHYLLYTANLPAGAQVGKSPRGDYTLEVHDIPPIPRAANVPPESSFLYRVRFYYTPYYDAQIFWSKEQDRWSKRIDQFAAQSDAIKQAANEITAGAATPDAKARKLYDAVQALDNTEFSRAKSAEERHRLGLKRELKKAQDVWAEKSGTANEIAALYLALARAAGLEAYGIQVADRDSRIFDPNLLSLRQLDALLVVVRVDGKDVFLDPGQKLCPYGQLAWTHMLAGGLQQNIKGPIFTPANLSKDAVTAHSADLTLDDHGAVSGTVKVLMTGPEALRWRQLALTTDAAEVQKQFSEAVQQRLPQGVDGTLERFEGLETPSTNLLAVIKVSGPLVSPSSKRLLVPAFFFSTGAHKQFVEEASRSVPVDLHYSEQVIDDVIYHLPQGYTVESAPQAAQLPWPQHAALVTKTTSAPGVIDIKHIFARTFVLLEAKDYPALRDFYQKVATNDQQQFVLSSTPSPAGN